MKKMIKSHQPPSTDENLGLYCEYPFCCFYQMTFKEKNLGKISCHVAQDKHSTWRIPPIHTGFKYSRKLQFKPSIILSYKSTTFRLTYNHSNMLFSKKLAELRRAEERGRHPSCVISQSPFCAGKAVVLCRAGKNISTKSFLLHFVLLPGRALLGRALVPSSHFTKAHQKILTTKITFAKTSKHKNFG